MAELINIEFDCKYLHTSLNFIKIAITDKCIRISNDKLLISFLKYTRNCPLQ